MRKYWIIGASLCYCLLFSTELEKNIAVAEQYPYIIQEKNEISLLDLSPIRTKVGWGELKKNETLSGTPIQLYIENEIYAFEKGLFAHAPSNIEYDISSLQDQYKFFQCYVGIDASRKEKGEVIFIISTSEDGENWTKRKETKVLHGNSKAEHICIPVENNRYLKLEAVSPNGNGDAHAVYGNPTFTKTETTEILDHSVDEIKYVSEYQKEIQEMYQKEKNYLSSEEKILLHKKQWLERYGYYTVQKIIGKNSEAKEALLWLWNQPQALEIWLNTGELGNKEKRKDVLEAWTSIYQKNKVDLTDPLLLKLAIAVAVSYSDPIYFWSGEKTISNPEERYQIFKSLYQKGWMNKGIASGKIKDFEELPPMLLRWVVNTQMHDKEILWLANYALSEKEKGENYLDAYHYIHYRMGYDYSKEKYHDLSQASFWNDKYHFADIYHNKEEYENKKIHHLWQVFEEGSVCGGLAKTYTNLQQIFGQPAAVAGQPGHAAAFIYSKKEGKPIWKIANDISGFKESNRGDFLHWGPKYAKTKNNGSYILLAQEAINHYENYQKVNDLLNLGNSLSSLEDKKEIYKKARNIQPLNLDVIYTQLALMKEMGSSEEDYLSFAKEVAKDLCYYPLPFTDIISEIEKQTSTKEGKARLQILQSETLKEMTQVKDESYIQAKVCREMAQFLQKEKGIDWIHFSLSNKEKYQLEPQEILKESGISWTYSLDHGQTKKLGNQQGIVFSKEEWEQLNTKDGIEIELNDGKDRYCLEVKKSEWPTNIYKNDWENQIMGTSLPLEYQREGKWYPCTKETRFIGNQKVNLRVAGHDHYLPSAEKEFAFTQLPKEEDYISLSEIKDYHYSSEQDKNKSAAKNFIDGNIHTMWHNQWKGDEHPYFSVELKEPQWITQLSYLPRQDGGVNGTIKAATIYTSLDGKKWEKVKEIQDEKANKEWKNWIIHPQSYAKYIAIQIKESYGIPKNQLFSGQMLQLYTTKIAAHHC